MTLPEFTELAEAVLALVPTASMAERCALIDRLLKTNRVYMPTERALVERQTRQQQEMVDAAKMAAAAGAVRLGALRADEEPS